MTRFLRLPLILALAVTGCAVAQGPPPTPQAPATVSSHCLIAPSSEPGRRLVIEGTVFAADGLTAAPGVIIYAYQTDDTGEYRNDQNGIARLHGWVRTGENGHFEFRTIVPGPYPKLSIARHVHFHAYGGGYPLQWTEELKFAGDPLLKEREIEDSNKLGQFAYIQPLIEGPDGVLHCQIKLRLSAVTNYPPQYRDDVRTK
jgi:protocatechuate 3,4-dioxygenase beta subunit